MSSTAVDVSTIAGNASDDIKTFLGDASNLFGNRTDFPGPIFGEAIQKRLRVTEVSVNKKAEEPKKLEGRVVLETVIEEDMLNGGGKIHGGCSAFLIDMYVGFSSRNIASARIDSCEHGLRTTPAARRWLSLL